MLGKSSALTFAFRAAVLLLLIPLAWIAVAGRYNEMLVEMAGSLPAGASLDAAGRHILVTVDGRPAPLAVDGFTLHYGTLLLAVLVLAAVRVGVVARVGWLVALGTGSVALQAFGLAALAQGLAWSAAGGASEGTVFRLFATFWGLQPATAGCAWCLLYWLPRASRPAPAVDAEEPAAV